MWIDRREYIGYIDLADLALIDGEKGVPWMLGMLGRVPRKVRYRAETRDGLSIIKGLGLNGRTGQEGASGPVRD